jgi:hypothetical protein
MSKKFYILTILATLVIAAAIVILFIYYKSGNQNNVVTEIPKKTGENYELLPIGELAKKPNLQIPNDKETININNVYKNPIEKLSQNGVAFVKNNDYYMAFYPQDNGFLLSINSSDVVSAERKLESDFLKQLGINKEQACELKVSITVPYDVSDKYSGIVYGLSFCPNVNHI